MHFWQLHMQEWEKNLDKYRFDIMSKLKITDHKKMDEIINVLKEYDVIMDEEEA